jgi:ribosomal protein L16 Arg81 hydroxylase
MSQSFGLEWLLGEFSTAEFNDHYWEKQPLVLQRCRSDYYRDLFALDDFDKILTTTDLRHPTISLAKDGPRVPLARYVYDVPISNGTMESVADVGKVLAEYHAGATLILQGVHSWWPPLYALTKELEARAYVPFHVNAYLTPPGSKGFAAHYDTHDVFILQIHGTKHWQIHESAIPLPHRSQPFKDSTEEIGTVLHDVTIQPGDLLYIPRGFVHQATACDAESLHLTLGVDAYTWFDVFHEILNSMVKDERFRRGLPLGSLRAGVTQEMRTDFDLLASAFADDGNLDVAIASIEERFIATRSPLLGGQLRQVSQLQQLALDSTVHRRPNVIYKHIADADGVALLFSGKSVRLPPYISSAVDFVLRSETFKVSEIPSPLDDVGKLVLVKRLILEGFLTRG